MSNLKVAIGLVIGLVIGVAAARTGQESSEPASAMHAHTQQQPAAYLPAEIELKPAASEAPVHEYN